MPRPDATSKTVQKALQIIDELARNDQEMGVSDLARALGMHKSTVYRLLATLMEAGYVRQNGSSEKYGLGLKFMEVAGLILDRLDLVKLAEPHLEELMVQTGETINLVVPDRGKCLYLKSIQGPHSLSTIARPPGFRDSAHSTAVGKALLAFLPEEELERSLEMDPPLARTANTIVDVERLRAQLEQVRSRGFALDDMENDDNVRCIGSPIFNYTERAVGAISVSGPAFRIYGSRVDEYAHKVRSTAAHISRRLGSRTRWRTLEGSFESPSASAAPPGVPLG